MRAIAAELVRQTPFRAQRCLNFLEILTTCPRGPVPLPDSPSEQRRRSRSEFRCWPNGDLTCDVDKLEPHVPTKAIVIQQARRRAFSEGRGWSSSNSSDEDNSAGHPAITIQAMANDKLALQSRAWGCSESSEGSDDSLTWATGLCRSALSGIGMGMDCVDSARGVVVPEATTREQRMARYKEARRKENEARRRQVLEEDARRRKAGRAAAEENNNDVLQRSARLMLLRNSTKSTKEVIVTRLTRDSTYEPESMPTTRLPPVKPHEVRFEEYVPDDNRNNNSNNNNTNARKNERNIYLTNELSARSATRSTTAAPTSTTISTSKPGILRSSDTCERRSRARERRVREKGALSSLPTIVSCNANVENGNVETLAERRERLTRFPEIDCVDKDESSQRSRLVSSLSMMRHPPNEEEVARLLERCQRVDRYVPVRDKLTLFESLSRMGGRLARSTEDLGRSTSNPSPRGKQRARSLHDISRGKSLPVREMCRFFENDEQTTCSPNSKRLDSNSPKTVQQLQRTRLSDVLSYSAKNREFVLHNGKCKEMELHNGKSPTTSPWRESPRNPDAPCVRMSTRRKNYSK